MWSSLVALVVIGGSARAAGPRKNSYIIAPRDCELLLRPSPPAVKPNVTPPSAEALEADAAARQLVSLITLDHPIVRSVVRRSERVAGLYDLLYVTSGYLLPPPRSLVRWLKPSPPVEHYDRVSRFGNTFGIIALTSLRHHFDKITAHHSHHPKRAEWLAQLITQSFTALKSATKPRDENPVDLYFQFENKPYFQRLALDMNDSFHPAETEELRHLFTRLDDRLVRERVVRLLDSHLIQILADQEKLYERLAAADTSDRFRAAFADHKALRVNSWLRPPSSRAMTWPTIFGRSSTASTPKARESSARAPHVPPAAEPEFDANAIETFIGSHKIPRVESLDELPFFEIYRSLQEGGEVLNSSLIQLQEFRALEPDMTAWRNAFDGSLASARRLTALLSQSKIQLIRSETQFARADHALGRLADWLGDLGAQIARMEFSGEKVAALPPQTQAVLWSVTTRLPQFTELMNNAVISTRGHRQRLLDRMDVISSLTLLVGSVIGESLGDDVTRESLKEAPAFAALEEALDHAGKGTSRGR